MTILITAHDKINNFITSLPLCKILKEQTEHKIVLVVSSENFHFANQFDFLDEVIEYSKDSFTFLNKLSLIKADISISSYIDFHLGLCLFLAKIPTRIASGQKISKIFFNHIIKQQRDESTKTELEYNLDFLYAFTKDTTNGKFTDTLTRDFTIPLLDLDIKREDIVIFHLNSGLCNDDNIELSDYLKLAHKLSNEYKIVFIFDLQSSDTKEFISKNLYFEAQIIDNFKSMYDLTIYINRCKLFISNENNEIHLAGLTNTPTVLFSNSKTSASNKRWATISEHKNQTNIEVPLKYDEQFYHNTENELVNLLKD